MNHDRVPVIDADGHVTEPPIVWSDYVEEAYRPRAPRFVLDEYGHPCLMTGEQVQMRDAFLLTLGPERSFTGYTPRAGGFDPAARVADLDAEGIDVAVLYPSIGLYFAELTDTDLQAALCRAYNRWLADYCRVAPERLVGVALLPLADLDQAVRELEHATERLGLRGAFVRPNPCAGRPLHHPAHDRLWACAAALGVPVAVHEGLADTIPTLGRERFDNAAIRHVLAHPFEQMAACAGFVLTGVLERHPDLRVAFLESGCSWLPYWLERMDEHWETWRALLPQLRHPPSEYFRRQCVVSMDPGEAAVEAVVRHVGDQVIVWASDYPHPDATFPGAVQKTLAVLRPVDAVARRRILADNAARLYGLDLAASTRRAAAGDAV
jgi:predicted TIM-barrel fold metal-dependent hydrolase